MSCPDCPRPPWRLHRWLTWLWIRLAGRKPIPLAVWRTCRLCKKTILWQEWV